MRDAVSKIAVEVCQRDEKGFHFTGLFHKNASDIQGRAEKQAPKKGPSKKPNRTHTLVVFWCPQALLCTPDDGRDEMKEKCCHEGCEHVADPQDRVETNRALPRIHAHCVGARELDLALATAAARTAKASPAPHNIVAKRQIVVTERDMAPQGVRKAPRRCRRHHGAGYRLHMSLNFFFVSPRPLTVLYGTGIVLQYCTVLELYWLFTI